MRAEKQLLLDQVKNQIEKAPAFLMMSYQGIDPNLYSDFRDQICNTGGFLNVVAKRIFIKAAKEAGISYDRNEIQGHLGIIYTGEDVIATTKEVYKFRDANKELLQVIGGHYEGRLCSPQEVEEISKLPSKEQMRAEFLGLLEAPMTGALGAMDAILSSAINCIENKIQKEESAQAN